MTSHAIGEHRVSITVLRKTYGDLLVSQHTMERWFINEETAVRALQHVSRVFIESETSTDQREDAENNSGVKNKAIEAKNNA